MKRQHIPFKTYILSMKNIKGENGVAKTVVGAPNAL